MTVNMVLLQNVSNFDPKNHTGKCSIEEIFVGLEASKITSNSTPKWFRDLYQDFLKQQVE